MSLTNQQIQLVQKSFAKVALISAQAADIFYEKLFELDPNLKKLFKGDLNEQKKMLMATLSTAVGSLTKLDQLVPVLQKLAERHVGYGVKPEHYTLVGNALLRTLKTGLGDDFTDETRDAWIATYRVIADTMKAHAYP